MALRQATSGQAGDHAVLHPKPVSGPLRPGQGWGAVTGGSSQSVSRPDLSWKVTSLRFQHGPWGLGARARTDQLTQRALGVESCTLAQVCATLQTGGTFQGTHPATRGRRPPEKGQPARALRAAETT